MKIITSHPRADFDAVASMLAAHKLYPDAVPVLPKPLGNNVAEFFMLYRKGLPFIQWDDFQPAEKITEVILVDTQTLPSIRGLHKDVIYTIIDHHPRSSNLPETANFAGDAVGAATTLLVEQIRQRGDVSLSSLEATLMTLGIYVDTGALTYGGTTPRDLMAAAWLLGHHASLDTVRRFLSPMLTDEQRVLYEQLLQLSENRVIEGYMVTVAAVESDRYIQQINSVVHYLVDALDSQALMVIVAMPQGVQLICRSRVDAIDVADIARYFGGGGHSRAAAATISDLPLHKVVRDVWLLLESKTKPITRVAELMSYGVKTIEADRQLSEIASFLRRVGHEGFPVVDQSGRIVGLLTRRDADRAMEHGMGSARVREVMNVGEMTLLPSDSVSTLEQRMVLSGWGQIPVVDESGKLMGIVTRTDLIQYWASRHPAAPTRPDRIDPGHIIRVMGEQVGGLVELIAEHGRRNKLGLYLVGGVVRDLLLERHNLDMDFVIEGDAIRFAQNLAALYGGEATYYRPFGTATWTLDAEMIGRILGIGHDELPKRVDFATSRNEFYEHPTALPSVYNSSIKLDLQRRDFTVNTLAIQLSPFGMEYRLLDFYGGLNDLEGGVIRVLHSLSFVDDPTRVLRAVRFKHRLGFEIDARTEELITTARPMLRRVSGQRIRDELHKILREEHPEKALLALQERGILPAIHLAFHFRSEVAVLFETARNTVDQWPVSFDDITIIYWHLTMMHINPEGLDELTDRLRFNRQDSDSFLKASTLIQPESPFCMPGSSVSQITHVLEGTTPAALVALWVGGRDTCRERIESYLREWRHIQPITNGHTLMSMGLQPGPIFRVILERLKDARLDGEISTDEEEVALLNALIETTSEGKS